MIPQSRTLRKSSAQPDAMRLDNLDAALLFKPQAAVFYSGDPSKLAKLYPLSCKQRYENSVQTHEVYKVSERRKKEKDEPPRC